MSTTPGWVCPSCQAHIVTEHCSTCGERRLQPRDLTLTGLLTHAFHSASSVDSKLLRTFRSLLTRPGELTAAYLQGRRKPFIGPFQFFLIVNVIFFAVQSFAQHAIFSTPLQSHLHHQDWSELAQTLVAQRVRVLSTTLADYAPLFNQAVEVNAKSLVILMTLPFALVLVSLFHRKERPFVTHLVFSLHFYAFMLVSLCVLLLVLRAASLLVGSSVGSQRVDWSLFSTLLVACAIYLYLAIGKVYAACGIGRFLTVLLLTVAVACGVLGYRFTIFLITLYRS